MQSLLFTPRRYDLGRVGRHKLNKRLGLEVPLETRTLTPEDLVRVVERMIQVNNGIEGPDDIDHLGNRRVKTMGELIQNQLRIGLLRMERVVRERMSIREPEQMTPISLINVRPVVAATREFFGGSQLSQFMQQTNPLDELTHKRRLSALGPAACGASGPALTCATCTTPTMAASAPSRRLKAPTSASSARWAPMAGSTSMALSRPPIAR